MKTKEQILEKIYNLKILIQTTRTEYDRLGIDFESMVNQMNTINAAIEVLRWVLKDEE